MKYTKIFNGNQYVTKFYCGKLTRWQRIVKSIEKNVKRSVIVLGAVLVILTSFYFGTSTKMATADTKIITIVSTSTPAVLQRIEKCESGNQQFNKDGQVLVHVNTDGSYDTGLAQVNSVWNAEATKMGYDLTKKKDNEAFALYLFNTKGSSPWSSSSKCWL